MAWIETIEDETWKGELAELRPQTVDPKTKRVDNIMAVHSLDAGSLRAHLALYMQAMRGTASLPKVDREMIALAVSQDNGCHY
ncbi:MAG: carboxymuconolactone decarboxylase family protein [Planctomycetota bacterium]